MLDYPLSSKAHSLYAWRDTEQQLLRPRTKDTVATNNVSVIIPLGVASYRMIVVAVVGWNYISVK